MGQISKTAVAIVAKLQQRLNNIGLSAKYISSAADFNGSVNSAYEIFRTGRGEDGKILIIMVFRSDFVELNVHDYGLLYYDGQAPTIIPYSDPQLFSKVIEAVKEKKSMYDAIQKLMEKVEEDKLTIKEKEPNKYES